MIRSAKLLFVALTWLASATLAFGQSTVNPAIPATNAPLASAPIRSNFAATTSDINGLLQMHPAASLGGCSIQTATVGADCLITSNPSAYQWYKYTGTNGYVLVGTINPSVIPPTFSSGLPPISNGHLIANCSGATGIPGDCAWTTYADQAITNANGSLPYRTGGVWSFASTGVGGHTIPFLDNSATTWSNPITVGISGTNVGQYCMANATSGAICLAPTTGALSSSVATFPANSGTVAELNLAQTWSALQTFQLGAVVQSSLTVTGGFTATGLVTNADLVNQSLTANGVTCTLGGTCTIATNVVIGTSLVTGGSGILYNSSSGGALTAAALTASAVFVTNGSGVPSFSTSALPIALGGTGGTSQSAALTNIMPTPVRTGDVAVWNGTIWATVPGNNTGTAVLTENAAGAASWSAPGTGTVTSMSYVASTGIGITGTTPCTNICTWTFTNAGVTTIAGNSGAFTLSGGITNSTNVIQLAVNSQVLQTSPSGGPSYSTASTTQVMAGFGASCHLTPSYSTRVKITFEGTVTNNTSGNTTSMNVRTGTGGAPALGAAVTGTAWLNSITSGGGTGALQAPSFNLSAIATGVAIGTPLWADMSFAASANTSTLSNMNCTMEEAM